MSNEIKNNPRTAILTEYDEPKEFMTQIFLNCDIFEESNQIQSRPIRSRSLHSLDMESATLLNEDHKQFSKPSMSEKLDDDDKIDKIFISGLPQFSSMSSAWQKE